MSEIICLGDDLSHKAPFVPRHVRDANKTKARDVELLEQPDMQTVIDQEQLTVQHISSLESIAPEDWNQLFPGKAENWHYYRACEASALQVFTLSAIVVRYRGRLVGAATMFEMHYRLDTTLGESFRSFRDWLAGMAPHLTSVPIAGLGSPMSEECAIGLDPTLTRDAQSQVFQGLLAGFEAYAKKKRVKILAIKDLTDKDALRFDEVMQAQRFSRMGSLPIAVLQLPYENEEDYLANLKPRVRQELRRKMRQAKDIDVVIFESIDEIADDMLRLYRATQKQRQTQYDGFDEVSDHYFTEVMQELQRGARVMGFLHKGTLVGFNLFLETDDRVIGKFVGLDYKAARKYNLYFVNWMHMVRYCLERRIPVLQVGQTTYGLKVRLGCQLKRSWIYFKHTGAFWGPITRALGPRMALDQSDDDLKAVMVRAQYISDE